MNRAFTDRYKILIISENHQFKNSLAAKLRMDGFPVEFSAGGFHTLHLLENQRDFNLLIFHEDMLDMPSMEIISLARHSTTKSDLPILFVSSIGTEEMICDMVLSGANDYIVQGKNFVPILERVQKYFQLFVKNLAA